MSQDITIKMTAYQAKLGVAAYDLLGLLEEAAGRYETAAHAYTTRNRLRAHLEEKKKS